MPFSRVVEREVLFGLDWRLTFVPVFSVTVEVEPIGVSPATADLALSPMVLSVLGVIVRDCCSVEDAMAEV